MTKHTIKCPDCGQPIASSGLASHRRGAPCLIATTIRRFDKKSWRALAYSYKSFLADARVPFAEGPAHWDRGFRGKHSRLNYALYTPIWAVEALTRTQSLPGKTCFPRALRIELLRVLRKSTEARKVFRSVVNLNADLSVELVRTVIGVKEKSHGTTERQTRQSQEGRS